MKKGILISFLALVVFGCSSDDSNTSLVGKWQLIQIYSDPGDGSGSFRDVESNKIIELFSDGTFIANGTLCAVSSLSDNQTTGTFSEQDFRILPDNCENPFIESSLGLPYEIKRKVMIITHFCIEGCAEKYIKIE